MSDSSNSLVYDITEKEELWLPDVGVNRRASVYSAEKSKGSWKSTAEGYLMQTRSVGTRSQGTGSLYIYDDKLQTGPPALAMSCLIGSVYQVGLVFNFVDKKNYMLFLADQKSESYQGLEYSVVHVVNSRFSRICKEHDANCDASGEFNFVVLQEGNGLVFYCGDKEVYRWDGQVIHPGTCIGLYSYRNSDAIFKKLSIITKMPDEIAVPDKYDGAAEASAPVVSAAPEDNFLSMAPPQSKFVLEYNEVSQVPLDSFYASLYTSSSVNKELPKPATQRLSRVMIVDYRPVRWYRSYRAILQEEKACLDDLERNKSYLEQLTERRKMQNFLAGDDINSAVMNSNIGTLDLAISEQRDVQRMLCEKDIAVRNRKQTLLREMNLAGYAVEHEGIPEKLHELGYDFQIIGDAPFVHGYEPIYFPYTQSSYKNEEAWCTAQEILKNKLAPSLPPASLEQFQRETEQLASYEADPALQAMETAILNEVAERKKTLRLGDDKIAGFSAEREAWATDKNILQSQIGKHADVRTLYKWLAGKPLSRLQYDLLRPGGGVSVVLGYNELGISCSCTYQSVPYTATRTVTRYKTIQVTFLGKVIREETVPYPAQETYTAYNDAFAGDPLSSFYECGMQVCENFIRGLEQQIAGQQDEHHKIQSEINAHEARIADLRENGLAAEREKFIHFWNNPERNNANPVETAVVYPDRDPLVETVNLIKKHLIGDKKLRMYRFSFESEGFYSQEGYPLREIHKFVPETENFVAILPGLTHDGRASHEQLTLLLNPGASSLSPKLPSIKFVETFTMEVTWKGYGLGELSHSFNLFPGEAKELIIEKKTALTRKTSKDLSKAEEARESKTSSFEDSLEDTFSEENKKSMSQKRRDMESEASDVSSQDSSSTSQSQTESTDVSVGGSYGPFSASASVSSQEQSSANWASQRSKALKLSQEQESHKETDHSSDILKKNVGKAIKKVASDVSRNNKVEVKEASSEEYAEEMSRKETISIQNPNMGRSINYNFFQLQNIYETTVRLSDVKVVISMETQMNEGYSFVDSRVYDLEEFGKIYEDLDTQDPRSTLVAAILARKIIKKYGQALTSGRRDAALRVPETQFISKNMIDRLLLIAPELDFMNKPQESIQYMKEALLYLKTVPFTFNETILLDSMINAVNTGAYHLESEVGKMPATEAYLEDRRNIETEKQRAALEHLRAQTKSGTFFLPVPSGVTTLTVNGTEGTNNGSK